MTLSDDALARERALMERLVEAERQARSSVEGVLRESAKSEKALLAKLIENLKATAEDTRAGAERALARADEQSEAQIKARAEIEAVLKDTIERERGRSNQIIEAHATLAARVDAAVSAIAAIRAEPWSNAPEHDRSDRRAPDRGAEFEPKGQDPIEDVDQLLARNGAEFIDAAYRHILGRPSDASGRKHYLARMRAGDSKGVVLDNLSRSREARSRKLELTGLARYLSRHRLYKLWPISVFTESRRLESRLERLDFEISLHVAQLAAGQFHLDEQLMRLDRNLAAAALNRNVYGPSPQPSPLDLSSTVTAETPTRILDDDAKAILAEIDKSISALPATSNLLYQGIVAGHTSPCLIMDYFHAAEREFRWTNGHKAAIIFNAHDRIPGSGTLTLIFDTYGAQRVKVRLNDKLAIETVLDGERTPLHIPVSNIRPGRNRLDFELPDAKIPGDKDTRTLALAFRSLLLST